MSEQVKKNMEIWSTRLQRELLALTSPPPTAESNEQPIQPLPDFVTIQDHEMNIQEGICKVSFAIQPKKKESDDDDVIIVVSLDASIKTMEEKGGTGTTTTLDREAPAYPFAKPMATLVQGGTHFPTGSTIQDGNPVDIELDWTPSLHLSDAILNISLKVKESILQSEPFHPAKLLPANSTSRVMDKAKRMGAAIKSKLAVTPNNSTTQTGPTNKQRTTKTKKKSNQIRIGDEISMLDGPWVDCQGVYSCKAIRRPKFVEEAMAKAARNREEQAAASGSLTSAFNKIANSARGVLEESFLMITDNHIIEMKSNKLNLSTGHIAFAIPIEMLAKLKFRRQESISLFFKPAPDDPLIYMCPDSSDCVHQIQAVLKRHGVKGKHTNAATHRAINQALHLVQEIQTMELALKHDPSVERVNEIMDLYRQAAERFESAGDIRHEEVVTHMRKFLALPLTIGILDGSYTKPLKKDEQALSTSNESGAVEGVVLETKLKTPDTIPSPADEEEEEVGSGRRGILDKLKQNSALEDDEAFQMNMEKILKEAEADLAKLKMEDDPELEIMMEERDGHSGDLGDDVLADFENMLKAADDELAALMSS